MDKTSSQLRLEGNGKGNKYAVEVIQDSVVYAKESKTIDHLPDFYYQVLQNNYLETKNTWKSVSDIQYFQRLINAFYKKYSKKSTGISSLIDEAYLMAKPTNKPSFITKKQSRLAKVTSANKCVKRK